MDNPIQLKTKAIKYLMSIDWRDISPFIEPIIAGRVSIKAISTVVLGRLAYKSFHLFELVDEAI